jgi:RND family efflux transporter MFP subunit
VSADLGRLKIDRNRSAAGPGRALKWTASLAVAAAILVGGVYMYGRGMAGTDVRVARVEVVGGGGQSSAITANGYVVARTHASVSSRVSGRLATLLVEEGSVVRRGDLLARIENDDYEASVAQAVADSLRAVAALGEAVANRGQLARDLERSRTLVARNLEAARTAEDLEAQLEAADARVAVQSAQIASAAAGIGVARANLENTFIRAPFDGTVLRKDAEVGEVVAPVAAGGGLTRGAVVTMADLETLEVEVDVNEAYIAQIVDEQQTRILLDAYPTASFDGVVRQIVPTADRQRATVQVKVSITGKDPRILPEMSARVEFLDVESESGAPMRILVPAEAVQSDGGGTWVWVVRDGRVTRTAIEAGPVSGSSREVRSGLSGGESIVLDPPAQLTDGGRVNVGTP